MNVDIITLHLQISAEILEKTDASLGLGQEFRFVAPHLRCFVTRTTLWSS